MYVGVIGGFGRMGRKLVETLGQNNYTPLIGERSNFEEIAEKCDTVVLSVKPADITGLCKRISSIINSNPRKLIVSVAAGIPHDRYFDWFDRIIHGSNVIRIMTTYFIDQEQSILGVQCDFNTYWSHEQKLRNMFNPEILHYCSSVSDMDIITVANSCAPAIYAQIYKSLLRAYINLGLSKHDARYIIQRTMMSTLNNENIAEPDKLINTVASPNGATAKGLQILKDNNLDQIISSVFRETYNRCEEIRRLVEDK